MKRHDLVDIILNVMAFIIAINIFSTIIIVLFF